MKRPKRRERPTPMPGYHPDNAAIPRETIGRSTLFGVRCVLVGYVFTAHPLKPHPWWVQTSVYFARTGLIVCLSEGDDAQEPMELGAVVMGDLIAGYAQRHIGGMITPAMFAELKPLFEAGPKGEWFWMEELPVVP